MPKDNKKSRKRKIERLEERLAKYRRQDDENSDPAPSETDIPMFPITENQSDQEEISPGAEVLSDTDCDLSLVLGETTSTPIKYGENIHSEIVRRLDDTLLGGLNREQKDNIVKTQLIPLNGKLLEAPKLNPELVGVLPNTARTRDSLLQSRQQDLGIATAGIAEVIQTLSKKDVDKASVLVKLSKMSQLMCHLHFQYTDIRRKLTYTFLEKNLIENLKDNKRGEYLYSDLEESVKAYNVLKRASNLLKPKPVKNNTKDKTQKNFQIPPRRHQNQAPPGRGQQRGYQARTYPVRPARPFNQQAAPAHPRARAKYP